MPSYNEPTKTNPTHIEPSKPDINYVEPHWTGATWKNFKGITQKIMADLTWRNLFKMFGNKISEPTYSETSKGTVNYTEPSKE